MLRALSERPLNTELLLLHTKFLIWLAYYASEEIASRHLLLLLLLYKDFKPQILKWF